ncbi:MAG: hypothetical protein JKX85_05850 [Phycisphaeraceae bacterium]|nr:hypothetical protein [Phycisphaeraceae bacterium]
MIRMGQGIKKTKWQMSPWVSLLGWTLLLCLTGCNSNATLRQAQAVYRVGDLHAAREHIQSFVAQEGNGGDRVIAYLEQGTIFRELQDLSSSETSFQIADERIDQLDDQPDISLSEEVYSTVTNMNNLVYRGYSYDRVMLSVYRALNNMQLGNFPAARVHLIRAYNRQVQAVDRNAKRIEKAQQVSSEVASDKRVDVARTQNDPGFLSNLKKHYGNLSQYHAYADYVNPFAEWLQGLYFFADAADGSDLERARKSMERTLGMVPANQMVRDDLAMIQAIQNGKPVEPMTYVIFATGTAPIRGEIRLDIPVFLVARDVDYVGVNFPKLVMNSNFLRTLNVHSQGRRYRTQLLADMDSIVAQEFNNQLPIIITRTIISAASKAAVAYGLQQTINNQNSWEALAIRLATAAYQVSTNEADLRTWASLPKQFQIARFPTPANRRIELQGNVAGVTSVSLSSQQINVVYVRSLAPYVPYEISQFSFGKGSSSWQNAASNSSLH